MRAKSLESSPNLCDLMDCSPPGTSVHTSGVEQWLSKRNFICCSPSLTLLPESSSDPKTVPWCQKCWRPLYYSILFIGNARERQLIYSDIKKISDCVLREKELHEGWEVLQSGTRILLVLWLYSLSWLCWNDLSTNTHTLKHIQSYALNIFNLLYFH